MTTALLLRNRPASGANLPGCITRWLSPGGWASPTHPLISQTHGACVQIGGLRKNSKPELLQWPDSTSRNGTVAALAKA